MFEQAIKIDSNQPFILNNRGKAYLELKRFEEALSDFDKAVAILPKVPDFHTDRGRAMAAMGRYDESIDAFNEARRYAPNDISALKYMGMALLKLNRVSEALGCFDEAVRQGSLDRDLWTARAKASEAAGEKQEAARSYLKALEIDSSDKVAWHRLGLLYVEMKMFAEANDCFDRTLEIDDSNSKVWMSKGFVMENLDSFQEAAAAYDRAIGLDSNDKEAWKSKGYAMFELGIPEQALRCFDHALTIDPYFEAASEGRKAAEDQIRTTKIEDYSRGVLDFEYAHGRPVSKEEAFRVCGIPYAFLNDVLDYLRGSSDVVLSELSMEGFQRYEELSREVLVAVMLKRDLSAHGMRLCDITVNFPELKVASAKRILSYVYAVEEHTFTPEVSDPRTDSLLRQALELPVDQKNVLGLVRNLGIGVYQARQLVTILMTFHEGGVESPTVSLSSIVSESFGDYAPYDENAPPAETTGARRRRHAEDEYASEDGYEEDEYEEEPPPRRKPARAPVRKSHTPAKRSSRRDETDEEDEGTPSDLVGRRCLFHGGVAISRCSKCKAVLCRECIRGSDRCPRCNAPLKGAAARPRTRASEDEEQEEEEEQVPPKPPRKPRKKGDESSKLEELSRL